MIPRLIKLFDARSTFLSGGFLVPVGNVIQFAQEASGWIRFALSIISHALADL